MPGPIGCSGTTLTPRTGQSDPPNAGSHPYPTLTPFPSKRTQQELSTAEGNPSAPLEKQINRRDSIGETISKSHMGTQYTPLSCLGAALVPTALLLMSTVFHFLHYRHALCWPGNPGLKPGSPPTCSLHHLFSLCKCPQGSLEHHVLPL